MIAGSIPRLSSTMPLVFLSKSSAEIRKNHNSVLPRPGLRLPGISLPAFLCCFYQFPMPAFQFQDLRRSQTGIFILPQTINQNLLPLRRPVTWLNTASALMCQSVHPLEDSDVRIIPGYCDLFPLQRRKTSIFQIDRPHRDRNLSPNA